MFEPIRFEGYRPSSLKGTGRFVGFASSDSDSNTTSPMHRSDQNRMVKSDPVFKSMIKIEISYQGLTKSSPTSNLDNTV